MIATQQGDLYIEELTATQLADNFGTPLYVYSKAVIDQAIASWLNALEGCSSLVCYAVKANSNIGVLNLMARAGLGFDIVSKGELARALAAGAEPASIIFSGVGKTQDDIKAALEAGIGCFNVESIAELKMLHTIAKQLNTTAPISIRVNPDVDAQTHPYISTGLKSNKFGISFDDAIEAYLFAHQSPWLSVQGIDCHIGSQITEISPFIDALDRVLAFIDQLEALDIHLTHLDLGGGLGVRYQHENPPSIADLIGAIRNRLGTRPLKLIFEPGRSIVANAGVLLSKVILTKENSGHHFAVVDAAMNDLLRPSLYNAWQDITLAAPCDNGSHQNWSIVGPICETGDFLGKDRALTLSAGALLAIHSSGAYGFSMASNYNSRPRSAEVIVDGSQPHLVRLRESVVSLYENESIITESVS